MIVINTAIILIIATVVLLFVIFGLYGNVFANFPFFNNDETNRNYMEITFDSQNIMTTKFYNQELNRNIHLYEYQSNTKTQRISMLQNYYNMGAMNLTQLNHGTTLITAYHNSFGLNP